MPHISFSALKNWNQCPYYYKLTYVDKIKGFVGNHYTAFGTALHEVCEKKAEEPDFSDEENLFEQAFLRELKSLPEDVRKDIKLKDKVITAHCPNPGSMLRLLKNGNTVWLTKSNNEKRKLKYTLQIIEVNTIPGLTETSLYPKAASFEGISFVDVVCKILLLACKGY